VPLLLLLPLSLLLSLHLLPLQELLLLLVESLLPELRKQLNLPPRLPPRLLLLQEPREQQLPGLPLLVKCKSSI
jgi:hypothetical protein